jgi:hypothetical protein
MQVSGALNKEGAPLGSQPVRGGEPGQLRHHKRSNYFYRDTVEEQIYQGIGEDFDWFTDVVGPAQPVLDQVERTIERVAMRAPSLERKQAIQAEVKDIRTRMDEARSQAITLKELQSVPTPHADQRPAITLPELEAVLTTGSERFHPHPHIAGALPA